MSHAYRGRCHCGNLSLTFESGKTPAELGVRACGCSFCRPRGARSASDNAGRVSFRVEDEATLQRYRFGERTADFLVCRTCGAYMGAMFADDDGSAYATLNSRFFENADAFPEGGQHVDYAAEDAEAKRARRRKVWTPVAEFRVGD
jgi:hypothetical protein